MRSWPVWVLGNAITSRMLLVPTRSMTSRSSPKAIPPWGGAPYCSASKRKPTSVLRCLRQAQGVQRPWLGWPGRGSARNHQQFPNRCRPSRSRPRCNRPELIQLDSSPGMGLVKGWWMAFQRPASSSRSNMGKSTTQRNFQAASSMRPRSRPSLRRSSPMTLRQVSKVSAPNRTKSPSLPQGLRARGPREGQNFAIPVAKPSAVTLVTGRPPRQIAWPRRRVRRFACG